MTAQQAREIINRLALATRFQPKARDDNEAVEDKLAEEFALWIDELSKVSYERSLEAANRGIETGRFRFMPTLAEFLGYMRELSGEGTPNAIGRVQVSVRPDEFGIWRQDQLVAMTDEEYWRYLTEPEYRDEMERKWRHEWAMMGGQSA